MKQTAQKSSKKIKAFRKRPRKGLDQDKEIEELKTQYESSVKSPDEVAEFKDFPLSKKTLDGLKKCNFVKPTLIQQHTILPGLQGRDILGAAKTGSGKTLAFLIPILEKLYVTKWTSLDGLGALIISPTRELAYQTFECLKKIGTLHDFSAGLIIGGKNLHFETKRMDKCNIIICTPGRLLQHMDENPLFDCSNLQILVLDEADRCLDMGFAETMNSIIENLPKQRQTLLFSATQTKSIKDLARLSLVDPMYISPHEQSEHCTPSTLQQNYIVCELEEKIAFLYSFIRNHLKQKCLVFMSSCKQVKYIYDSFCKLRPGTSLLALYGTLHQERREQIYEEFCSKQNVVMFATDLAARGLDFPQVNWVIQLDCPEDVETYIHRAGRTARHVNHGESLLVLLPNEEEVMIDLLRKRKVPINKIQVDVRKLQTPQRKLEALLAEHIALKESAQRAFVSYVKSVHLMKNKKIFDVHKLNTDAFANSLGLVVPPRIRFLQRIKKNESLQKVVKEDFHTESIKRVDNEDDIKHTKPVKNNTKTNTDMLDFAMNSSDSDSDDDLMKIKRKDHTIEDGDNNIQNELDNEQEELLKEADMKLSKSKTKVLTKAAVAKKILKKKIIANRKTVFDDQGDVIRDETKEKQTDVARDYEADDSLAVSGIDIQKAKEMLQKEDEFDKQKFREKLKARKKEMKRKLKNKKDDGEQEVFDEFGEESEEDVDLSWLPDPDKIYGRKDTDEESDEFYNNDNDKSDDDGSSNDENDFADSRNSDEDGTNIRNTKNKSRKKDKSKINTKPQSVNSDSDSENSDVAVELPKKRKRKLTDNVVTVNKNSKKGDKLALKKKQKLDIDKVTSGLTLNETEELAMKLLFK